MSAAVQRCPSCNGRPHARERGCARCDDTGLYVPPEAVEVYRAPIEATALRRAKFALHDALRGARLTTLERERAARVIGDGLSHEPADPIPGVMEWARVDRARAAEIVAVYVEAIRRRARVVRRRSGLLARALETHAKRVERSLSSPLLEAAE